ncbi:MULTISPECIES: Fic/DOC family N-terminal domain-containing protein [unclassified Methylobacterium]|uniref:Fic family protein n=2 Tax=Methylobacterium TaxID=407 RepID=UPI001AEEB7C8|nr:MULTISPECIES: Fic/DOC family N-terminal domain-containing protein [unclassified Methylobacterium]
MVELDWRRLLPLVGKANAALARYDGMLQALLNPAVLLSPVTANEAVLSSRIEGTVATLEEVLQQDAGIEQAANRHADLEEISNYRNAMRDAEQSLQHRPLSLSLIKGVHQHLLQGVRGHDKAPGNFRNDQNWIGRPNCKMENARFIPPSPIVLPQALDDWAIYLASEEEDPIVQVAVAHAQFEILHPFKDGNGRIGRMIIPLLLFQKKTLSSPMFYLSEFLESHRTEYYDALLSITKHGDWQSWIEFFLTAIISQADVNLEKVKNILILYESKKQKFIDATRSQFAVPALDAFFMRPIINTTDFATHAGIENRVTANGIITQLHAQGLIHRVRKGAGRTPSVFALPELINITEGREVMPLALGES